MEKQITYDAIFGSKHSFRFPVLLRGVRTIEAHMDAINVTYGIKLSIYQILGHCHVERFVCQHEIDF